MGSLPSYFTDFLSGIRLTDSQVEDCITGHKTLRDRLLAYDDLAPIIVDTFLQGSYRRSTAVRPADSKTLMDVDVVVVTSIDRNQKTATEALDTFKPFLEKYYKGKYHKQGRSWGIELSYVELDLVPTSAPSAAARAFYKSASVTTSETLLEAKDWALRKSWVPFEGRSSGITKTMLASMAEEKDWQAEPLWIPDRDASSWDQTNPLEQIRVTAEKNKLCNGHFVNVVKCLKWWRAVTAVKPKYPKSYPLEHLAWTCCPDGIDSVAKGVVATLEGIRDGYAAYGSAGLVPNLPDHGVPSHNVLGRLSSEDWRAFFKVAQEAASVARKALDEPNTRESVLLWKTLFGSKFPDPPPDSAKSGGNSSKAGGFSERTEPTVIGGGRFA